MQANSAVKVLGVVALVTLLVLGGGCKGKKPQIIDTDLTPSSTGTGTTDTSGTGTGLPNVDQETLLWSPATGLQKVYFDYDSFALRPDAISTLNENADKIRQVPGVLIQIEGHCDERGTQEYNLALGEKRGLAVRDYLIKLGVPSGRLLTISYGEERAAVEGHDESAWKWNRRCEFNKTSNL